MYEQVLLRKDTTSCNTNYFLCKEIRLHAVSQHKIENYLDLYPTEHCVVNYQFIVYSI